MVGLRRRRRGNLLPPARDLLYHPNSRRINVLLAMFCKPSLLLLPAPRSRMLFSTREPERCCTFTVACDGRVLLQRQGCIRSQIRCSFALSEVILLPLFTPSFANSYD